MNNKPGYVFSADVIRCVAIFGVIAIHTANAVYTRLDFFGGATWWFAIMLDSFSRISIPLFIMLSGYLILRKDESFKQSLKRIFFRIVIPFIFWVPFYFWLGTGIPSLSRINLSIIPKIFYSNVYHLYFLIIILGLYFVAPKIRFYLHNISSASQYFFMKFLLILGVTLVALQFTFNACASENFFTRWIPYTGFFVAGFVLGNNTKRVNNYKLPVIYSLGLVATLGFNYLHYYLLVHNYSFLNPAGCLSHYSDHYLSVNVVIMSLCAFLLLLNHGYENIKKSIFASRLIHSVAKASFGIYLIQPAVARFLEIQFHLAVDFNSFPIFVIIVSKLFLVFAISYVVTVILSRIPLVKLVFGKN